MAKIKQLDLFTSNRIAAGEVVERPLSVAKELLENAIDAGATAISVEIKEGGIRMLRVSDNGSGIEPEDAGLAFSRHATSKINSARDLDAIETLGFRGEALCSIAAVSQIEMQSRIPGADEGVRVIVRAGEIIENAAYGCPDGTMMLVENLFFNTPARLKFLKKPAIEGGYIGDYMARMIMDRPDISFKFINDGKLVYHSTGDGQLLSSLHCVYGKEMLPHLKEVDYHDEDLRIFGYVSGSEGSKANRTYQSFFVNGRYIKSTLLSQSIQKAFGTRLMGGRFPLCALKIELPYDEVDVNIHPNKMALRFKDEVKIADAVEDAIEKAITGKKVIRWQIDRELKNEKHEGTDVLYRSGKIAEEAHEDIYRPSLVFETQPEETSFANPPTKGRRTEIVDLSPSEEGFVDEEERNKIDDSFLRDIEIPENDIETFRIKESLQPNESEQVEFVPERESFQILGQAFATYVFVQQGETLFLIDQHAAHERILFDLLSAPNPEIESQLLLGNITLQLTPEQMAQLKENEELIRGRGFSWIENGNHEILLNSVPQFFGKAGSLEFLPELLDALSLMQSSSPEKMRRDTLAQYACKHAIKGKQNLSYAEIEMLLERFKEMKVLHCPHGRPVILRIDKKDLEKAFGRIV